MTISGLEKIFAQDGKALYLAVADHVTQLIQQDELKDGEKLPTQRELAKTLGVTTGTVTRAFQELERRGLVSGEVGRGTFVRGGRRAGERHDFGKSVGESLIDMAYNLPPQVSGELEGGLFRDGLRSLAGSEALMRAMHYHFPQTDEAVREAGRSWLGLCGVEASPAEILATAGAQNALFLALLVLCRPGEEVACEALTYPGFRYAAEALRLRVGGLAMDAEGVLPEALEEACKRGVRVAYLVPTLQNPTTATMGTARRQALVGVARRHGLTLIEDDIHALLSSEPMPPLCSLAPELVWYLGNTDKILAPGLRTCFVRVPQAHQEAAGRLLMATQWMTPPLGLWLATHWIQEGKVSALIEARKAEASARMRLVAEALGGCGVLAPRCAYHAWLPLPASWRGETFQLKAREGGVAVSSAEAYATGLALPNAVRLCIGGAADRGTLAKGLGVIRRLLDQGPGAGRRLF